MNSAVLVAALVAPLVGALGALLVPTGKARRPRRPSRRARRKGATTETATDDATPAIEIDRPEPTPLPDPAAVARAGLTSRNVVRFAALAAAALWVAVTLLGPSTAGPALAVGPIGPAAAGAALLLAGVARPARRLPAAGAALALALGTAGLALGAGDGGAGRAVAGLAVAVGLIAVTGRNGGDGSLTPPVLALAGTAALAGGLIRAGGGDLDLPANSLPLDGGILLVAGSAAVAVAAALRPRGTVGILLPIALALGVPVAAVIGDAGEAVAVVLMLLAATAAAAWAGSPRSPRGDLRPLVATLALASLAAAAVPTSGVPGSGAAITGNQAAGLPAAWLLAAAAVVTGVSLVPVAALCALPGAAALVVVLVADPAPARFALIALAVAAATATATAVRRAPPPGRDQASEAGPVPVLLGPLLAAVPALAVGSWLIVAPGSWSWAGDVDLEGWTDTVALALAGGLIAAVAAGATGRAVVPGLPRLAAPDPVGADAAAPTNGRLALVAAVALGLALLALLTSTPA